MNSSTEPPRINLQYVLSEIGSVLSFQKGILYTIRELLIRPGSAIRSFLFEDRKRLVKPILFLIFCSLVYTILQQLLHFEDSYFDRLENEPAVNTSIDWVRNNWGYVNILMSLFNAIAIKILFWKREYNFFELLVLLFYLMGISMLIYSFFGIIEALSGLEVYMTSAAIALIYMCWAIGQFFGKPLFFNFIKALLSYLFGMVLFTVSIIALDMLIEALF